MGKTKRLFSLLIVLIVLLLTTGVFAESNFTDIKSTDWYTETVAFLTKLGIISGYTDGTFRPNNPVTTAEFLKLSLETAGIEVEKNTNPWYKGVMDKSLSLGIITRDLYSNPNAPIKRKDVAVVLVKLIEKTPSLKSEFITGKNLDYDRFKYLLYDTTKLSQEYRNAIYKLFEYQLIIGTTNEKDQVFYKPDSNLTRAEIATIIERLIEPSKRLDKFKDFPKRKDYFEKYVDGKNSLAHNYELNQHFSAHWATPDIENERFIYTSEELGIRTENYILSEEFIPNLNKIVWDLSRVLIKESGFDYVSNELWGLQEPKDSPFSSRVYIQKSTDELSTYTSGNSWSYMFAEKKPLVGYDEIGYNNFLCIRVGALWNKNWRHIPTSYVELNGLVEYEYVNMFRASLIAIFGEKDGHEIFEYIFSEYVAERSNPNIKYGPNNAKYKYKTIGKYKIVYRYGENSSLSFYFSFK